MQMIRFMNDLNRGMQLFGEKRFFHDVRTER